MPNMSTDRPRKKRLDRRPKRLSLNRKSWLHDLGSNQGPTVPTSVPSRADIESGERVVHGDAHSRVLGAPSGPCALRNRLQSMPPRFRRGLKAEPRYARLYPGSLPLQLHHCCHHRVDLFVQRCYVLPQSIDAVLQRTRLGFGGGLILDGPLHSEAYLLQFPADPPEGTDEDGAPQPFGDQSFHGKSEGVHRCRIAACAPKWNTEAAKPIPNTIPIPSASKSPHSDERPGTNNCKTSIKPP